MERHRPTATAVFPCVLADILDKKVNNGSRIPSRSKLELDAIRHPDGTRSLAIACGRCRHVLVPVKTMGSKATHCVSLGLGSGDGRCPNCSLPVICAARPKHENSSRALYDQLRRHLLAGSVSGMWTTHQRLKQQSNHSSFEFIVACFFIFGCCFFLALPACVTPREAVRRSQCKSNLKQIGTALHNYHDAFSHLPKSAAGKPAVSWRVHALPFLDHPEIYDTYDQAEAWDSDSNGPFTKQRIYHLTCPSSEVVQDTLGRYFTHYAMVEGAGTFGNKDWSGKFSEMTDGTSNTLAVVEAAGLNIVWTEPRDSQVSDNNLGINLTGPTPTESPALISAWHRSGGHVLMADGAARFLSHNIDPNVLKALTTVNGDDSVEDRDAW